MSLFSLHNAFTHFYNAHKDDVYGYILVRVNFNEAIAEDIVRDIFTKAYTNFETGIVDEHAWIFRISKNTLIDYYKKSKSYSWESSELDALFDENEHFYHKLEIELTMNQVQKHIEKLPSKQKNIVESYYIRELSSAEIANALGITQDAVRQNLSRGIKRLRKIYE